MRYPGYEEETVANPWVFADLYQPQRMRGPVSPVVFQTAPPSVGDPYLDGALRVIQGDMGEVGARLPTGTRGMGNYDILGSTAADRVVAHPAGMLVEADIVPRGIPSSAAARAAQQVQSRLSASGSLRPMSVGWGSGVHAGKIHVVAATRVANLTAWEILSEMRQVAAQAAGDVDVAGGLTVPSVSYQGGATAPASPGKTGVAAPVTTPTSKPTMTTGQTVIDALLREPAAPLVTTEEPRMGVPGWALGVGAVVVTGGILYALRRGGRPA